MNDVDIRPASLNEKPVLRHLLELCQHDYSEFNHEEVNEHGLFGYKYLGRYWTESGRHPYLVRVAGRLAGFVLVRTLDPTAGESIRSIAEFFILRRYRRRGLGRDVAFRVFDMLPGEWSVAQEAGNRPAQAFWRRVIAEYTGGEYREMDSPGEWSGPVQRFRSPGRGSILRYSDASRIE